MKKPKIPLYDIRLPRAAILNARETLESGWLSSGSKVQAFERAMAHLNGVPHAAAVGSATAGLIAAMRATGISGGEVITSPFSFVATAEAVFHCGARPVFADIDPVTLNIDPEQVVRCINQRTVGILPVDVAGFPADYANLRKIARGNSLPLVADSSHALGAKVGGKTIPQLADAAVFSFHATKNLTCGEGGMVLSRYRRIADEVRLLVRHGVTATAYQRKRQGRTSYDVTRLGMKGNLSEVHASIGLGGLPEFEKNQERRKLLAARYDRNLKHLAEYVTLPPESEKVDPAWHLYIVRLKLSRLNLDRDQFIQAMAQGGIECGVHFVPIPKFSYYRRNGYSLKNLPNAARAGREVVSLPLFPELKAGEVDRVCDQMARIFKRYRR